MVCRRRASTAILQLEQPSCNSRLNGHVIQVPALDRAVCVSTNCSGSRALRFFNSENHLRILPLRETILICCFVASDSSEQYPGLRSHACAITSRSVSPGASPLRFRYAARRAAAPPQEPPTIFTPSRSTKIYPPLGYSPGLIFFIATHPLLPDTVERRHPEIVWCW